MRRSLLSVLLLVCFSCSKPLPELVNVNLKDWKDDYKGCLGKRTHYVESVRVQKDKLKGLNEWELVQLLGKPDRNELSERNEKFYYYFFESTEGCKEPLLKLIIRFNAVGLSKQVLIE